ncbi:MAG TPA: transporter [Gemmatimonas aurantiaca]|uniref:Transporter n=2 Tax=Gemmatimonas aurantiaca TaxID=173480 RepID=A0A3D4VAW2_9BACT|nr:putative inward rectifier potassium channel protein [Gemmatimonas aurantiaca]BAH40222.1 putative inward rectifier potassium channel protein [Gemmatimonas aurantiaca T-27]HCT57768.1 transporter [Gemmatimonas aurantiaca]
MTAPATDHLNDTDAADISAPAPPADSDLGFGRVVAQQTRGRFLSKDGRATARKFGLGGQRTEHLYLRALNVPWGTFLLWTVGAVLLMNGIFALGYGSLGSGAIAGAGTLGLDDPFMRAFVYSVGAFTTTGTDGLHAMGSAAHLLTIMQSLIGPLTGMIIAGLVIARLTRPRARLRFSESAVIAPYEGGRGLMFRFVNELPSELTDVTVSVNLFWYEDIDGKRERNFHVLTLEREHVAFFPLHWTVVHPITADSPMRGVTPERLCSGDTEILVLITAHEETFSTHVSVRASYRWDEVSWDAKFANIFTTAGDDALAIDVDRLSRFDRLPEGTTRIPAPAEGAPISA